MSTALFPPAAGDFDGFDDFLEFEAITADFDEPQRPPRRTSGWLSEREAIDEGLGFRRHRSREREV